MLETALEMVEGALDPRSIDGHEIVRKLGAGGWGTVYLARQPVTEQLVALKVLREELVDAGAIVPFAQEAWILGQLQHRGIVPIIEARGLYESPRYFVMRWIEGGTLEQPVWRATYHNPQRAVWLMIQIASAMQFAHANRVVHRDLKPSNILIDEDGRPYVSDFGVAVLLSRERVTLAQTIAGTLPYMSPEQAGAIENKVDERSDVYALGAMLYELLAGVPPYEPCDLAHLKRLFHAGKPVALRRLAPEVSAALERVCMRALEHDPESRYATAAELVDDLKAVQQELPRAGTSAPGGIASLVVAGGLLLAFGTPIRSLWARPHAPWWGAYLLWLTAIAALFAIHRLSRAGARAETPEESAR